MSSAVVRNGTYVAITGAIGAGASTFGEVLRRHLGWQLFGVEDVPVVNPFFRDAYRDFPRWGFHSQVTFMLNSVDRHDRLRAYLAQSHEWTTILEDRTPFEHVEGYLPAYRAMGLISAREADLLGRLGMTLAEHYVVPDLVVYRRVSPEEAVDRVRRRARAGEAEAPDDFLLAVRDAFEEMFAGWRRCPVLIVDEDVDVYDDVQATRLIEEIRTIVPKTIG